MGDDAYGRLAGLQDLFLEPLISRLRDIAVSMAAPSPGMRVLDVGCGTGQQLDRYVHAGCSVAGVDLSPAMLERARRRLPVTADLRLADATHLPYDTGSFDLVTATLMLHELSPERRMAVAQEMVRVLAGDGRLLLIDFHSGPTAFPKGWATRAFSVGLEFVAGHLSQSRTFLAEGGIPALANRLALDAPRTKIVANGTLGLYLLVPRS